MVISILFDELTGAYSCVKVYDCSDERIWSSGNVVADWNDAIEHAHTDALGIVLYSSSVHDFLVKNEDLQLRVYEEFPGERMIRRPKND